MNKNHLIDLLPKKTQESLQAKAQLIELTLSQVICTADSPFDYIYFPVDGFISVTQSLNEHPAIEVGMVGREGVLGAESVLGIANNPFGALVQGAGSAWQIGIGDFLAEIKNRPELSKLINSYLAVRIKQLGLSAACEHFHEIDQRLAKWLLMSQDRAQSPTFSMTHEFISLMLGVRRVGITTTAADFRRRGLIEYHRGEIKVINRTALQAEACSCYEKNRKIYAEIFSE
jgi:CRP-like cAMP-binding protein